MTPELWKFIDKGSPYAADIWALGEIVFDILTKEHVFAGPGSLSLYKSPQDFPADKLCDVGVTQIGITFVKSLMQPHPDDRVTAKVALEDPWLESSTIEPVKITEKAQAKGLGSSRLESLSQKLESLIVDFDNSTGQFAPWTTLTQIPPAVPKKPTPEPIQTDAPSPSQNGSYTRPNEKKDTYRLPYTNM
jgi:serine/threonine protein kinase